MAVGGASPRRRGLTGLAGGVLRLQVLPVPLLLAGVLAGATCISSSRAALPGLLASPSPSSAPLLVGHISLVTQHSEEHVDSRSASSAAGHESMQLASELDSAGSRQPDDLQGCSGCCFGREGTHHRTVRT
jgi:hypothetical protein